MLDMRKKKLDGLDTNKIIKNSGAYAILLLAVFAMVFFGICNPSRDTMTGPRGTAAKIGSQEISGTEFRRAYQNNYDQYSRQFGDSFDPGMLKIAEMTLNQLIDQRLGVEFANSLGVVVGDQEIIEGLGKEPFFKDAAGNFSKEKFESFLRGSGYSEATLMEEQRRAMVNMRAMQMVSDLIYVSPAEAKLEYQLAQTKRQYEFVRLDSKNIRPQFSDDDVKTFLADEKNKAKLEEEYAKRNSEFNQAERLKARHILISFKGARGATGAAAERSKEAAKDMADQALARAQAAGADFAKLAEELTDEPAGKSKGGDLGEFSRDDMVKEFSDAAFALQPGQISSAAVESPFGYHVIKVEDHIPAKTLSLDEAKPVLARDLLSKEKSSELIETVTKELQASLKEGNEAKAQELMQKWGLKWETTDLVGLENPRIQSIGASDELNNVLRGLNATNKLAKEALTVNDAKFILRFHSEQAADMNAYTDEEAERFSQGLARTRGYSLYNEMSEKFKKSLEKSGDIWKNQNYLAIDQQQTKVQPGEG